MKKVWFWLAAGMGGLIFLAVLSPLFLRIVFQPFWIPAGSMKPTLLVGDYIFVDRTAYDRGAPQRGDVAVFTHPTNGAAYISRIIGLPGDLVQVKQGQLYLNNGKIPVEDAGVFSEPYGFQGPARHLPRCKNLPVPAGGDCQKDRLRETLPNGVRFHTLNLGYIENAHQDETEVYAVPDGHYFLMGDNRDNSSDSRVSQTIGGAGFVPRANLIGRAERVAFSSTGPWLYAYWDWRPDRLWVPIE